MKPQGDAEPLQGSRPPDHPRARIAPSLSRHATHCGFTWKIEPTRSDGQSLGPAGSHPRRPDDRARVEMRGHGPKESSTAEMPRNLRPQRIQYGHHRAGGRQPISWPHPGPPRFSTVDKDSTKTPICVWLFREGGCHQATCDGPFLRAVWITLVHMLPSPPWCSDRVASAWRLAAGTRYDGRERVPGARP